MMLIQIFFVSLFIVAFIKVILRYYRKEIQLVDALFWSIVWVGGGIVVLKPDFTFYIARFLGVGRGADVVVYSALILIFFILFRLTITLERFNRNLTLLTRKKTFENIPSKDSTTL